MNCMICGINISPSASPNSKKIQKIYCSLKCRRRACNNRYYKKYPEKKKAVTYKSRENDPDRKKKEAARSLVYNHIKRGDIVKPVACQRCGSTKILHAHHYRGYDHPLAIIWLCCPCHALAHRQANLKIGGNYAPT